MKKKMSILLTLMILLISGIVSIFLVENKEVFYIKKSNKNNNLSSKIETNNDAISIVNMEDIIYEKKMTFTVQIKKFNPEKDYKIKCKLNNNELGERILKNESENVTYDMYSLEEGKNSFEIKYYENNNEVVNQNINIYYIEPYTKQFLDEYSSIGFSTHFGYMYSQDGEKDIELMKKMGCFNVRDDIRFNLLRREDGLKWVNRLSENDIKLYAIIMPPPDKGFGSDKILNSLEELNVFKEIMKFVLGEIDDKVYKYEMYNEPNWTIFTQDNIKWYSVQTQEVINMTSPKRKPSDIIIGATCASGVADNKISSINFLREVQKNDIYKYNVGTSFHSYDLRHSLNHKHKELLQKHLKFLNENGGFQNLYVSEYGIDTSNYGKSEDYQSDLIIRQTIYNNMYNVKNGYIYGLRDMGFDLNNAEHYYGVVTHDYKPKKAYYAVKEYFERLNGAEYIGKIETSEELETHVYNKDGKPVIIAWSNNNDKNIEIDYKNFTAKDIYGKEIKPNENGKLQITTSPVYIYNLDNKYYYKAISNTALQKYTEFEQKFQPEISNIPGLQQKIDSLKQYIKQTENKTTESENIAKQKMKEHFELGNTILSEYKKGQVNIEYVKLSSMLDMLNDIGNSYEDLVTVSAKTRNPNLSETKTIINDAEKNINTNADLEIIYPQKILEFSKDLYEKAEYINSLEEENDIKTGLIISSDLHAKYLAQWSKEFTDIYIEDYIKNNPITETYSTKKFTNQDVTVTLHTLPDTKITNNKNSNTYTFTQNGEFIFEYQRRGRNFTKTVKVENIDKIAPQILNIKNDAQYTESIIPKIEEENLEKVTLTKNEKEVEYKLGEAIKEEGKYKLTVTDKAGNTSEVNFEIKKEQENSYIIDEDKIRNIKNNTTKEEFIKKLNISGKFKILHNDKELESGSIISSGDILKCENGKTYTLIVAGDINKDGKVTAYDLSMLRKTILNVKELNEIEKLAADVNCDNNKIGAKDYSSMKLIILGK